MNAEPNKAELQVSALSPEEIEAFTNLLTRRATVRWVF